MSAPLQDYIGITACFCGETAVGKTTLCHMLSGDRYSTDHVSTIGVDHHQKNETFEDGVPYRLRMWCTGGGTRMSSIRTTYYRQTHVLVLCFSWNPEDVATTLKFLHTVTLAEAKAFGPLPVVLCGARVDERLGTTIDELNKPIFDSLVRAVDQFSDSRYRIVHSSSKEGTGIENVLAAILDLSVEAHGRDKLVRRVHRTEPAEETPSRWCGKCTLL